jgi:hypothetical protein
VEALRRGVDTTKLISAEETIVILKANPGAKEAKVRILKAL